MCVCGNLLCVCLWKPIVCVCGNLLCVCVETYCVCVWKPIVWEKPLTTTHTETGALSSCSSWRKLYRVHSTLCISVSQQWQGFIQVLGSLAHPLAQVLGSPPSTIFYSFISLLKCGFNSLSPQKRFCLSLLSFLLLIFSVKTVLRNAEWSTTGRITQSALVVNPGNAKVQMSMGNELAQQVRINSAY